MLYAFRYVLGSDLFLCGKHVYNHYRDCKDVGSYLCGDCIVDIVAFYSLKVRYHPQSYKICFNDYFKSHRLISLIACEGRMVRAIEHARVTASIEVESSPTVLFIYEDHGDQYILFGTSDGRIGLLEVEMYEIICIFGIKYKNNSRKY